MSAPSSRRLTVPPALAAGYQAFATGRLRLEQNRFRELARKGQAPRTLVVGCCDSRVPPEVIFDARPGDLFVVRNVANLVPAYDDQGEATGVAAALEYAVQSLRVREIVVLGHARCGGVRAFGDRRFKPLSPGNFVGRWMLQLEDAEAMAGTGGDLDAFCARLELASLRLSLSNLRTYPCIAQRERAGRLTLHGLYFGIADGTLFCLDEPSGRLEPVPVHDPRRATRFQAMAVPATPRSGAADQ